MSQIEDLQARITRALDRIEQGIDGMQPAGPAPEEFEALRRRAEAAEQALAETGRRWPPRATRPRWIARRGGGGPRRSRRGDGARSGRDAGRGTRR